jgi:hypothetical protein
MICHFEDITSDDLLFRECYHRRSVYRHYQFSFICISMTETMNHVWRCNQFFLWVYITMYDIYSKKNDRKGWLMERKIVNEKNASIDYRKNSAISISRISLSVISISMIFLFDNVCFGVNFGHFTFRRFIFWRWGTQSFFSNMIYFLSI